MRTAIIGHSPAFTLNLQSAFSLLGEARTFHANQADYRQHDNCDLLDTELKREEAKDYINDANIVFVSGAISLTSLALIGGSSWVGWIKGLCRSGVSLAVYGNDSPYFYAPQYYDGLIDNLRATFFLMPNLINLTGTESVPLHLPQLPIDGVKTKALTIIHSPGRAGKMEIKGTTEIEKVIARLQGENLFFEYRRIVGETYQNCLLQKSTAHIIIDQLPAAGLPRGLGSSGLEGLAAGAAVLTDMYDRQYVDGFFEMPPVVPAHNPADLYGELKSLITDKQRLEDLQAKGKQWNKDNLEPYAWINYIGKYLG